MRILHHVGETLYTETMQKCKSGLWPYGELVSAQVVIIMQNLSNTWGSIIPQWPSRLIRILATDRSLLTVKSNVSFPGWHRSGGRPSSWGSRSCGKGRSRGLWAGWWQGGSCRDDTDITAQEDNHEKQTTHFTAVSRTVIPRRSHCHHSGGVIRQPFTLLPTPHSWCFETYTPNCRHG